MKGIQKVFLFIIVVVGSLAAGAQVKVQTVVPKQKVVVGNAFQVQYVVQDLDNFEALQAPDFGADFRLVSGPRIYTGAVVINGIKIPIQNYIYTVVPLRIGRLQVQGATATYHTGKQESQPAFVTCAKAVTVSVLGSAAAGLPSIWQNTSDDIPQKIGRQLFVKAVVNKKECYVGEPIVATFTLYSSLQSASEVVKNPGFYGFSVVDMPRSSMPEEAEINGYNKHLLRQVQLYPMQAGRLVIDEMSVNNLVTYVEPVTGEALETSFVTASAPVEINVKPLPEKSKPHDFTGAVGDLKITAGFSNAKIGMGEAGKLVVTISGKGNFLQMDAPEIKWPAGVEGFEPEVTESIEKESVPVYGQKHYAYTFAADSLGRYTIPPVAFTYFNSASKSYQTLTTDSLSFTIVPRNKLRTFLSRKTEIVKAPAFNWAIAALAVLVAGAVAMVFMQKRRKENKKFTAPPTTATAPKYAKQVQAIRSQGEDDKEAYRQLQQTVYAFLKSEYHIAVSSKASLQQQLQAAPITERQKNTLLTILQECEKAQYLGGDTAVSFASLQQQATAVIQQLEKEA